MTDIETLIRDLVFFINRDFKGDPDVLEGLIKATCKGYQRLIFEDGKTSFSITQKGIDYVEAMPFQSQISEGTEP